MQNPFKRIKDPVEGRMHVLSSTANNPDLMRTPCHITYVIQAEGVPEFSGARLFDLWCKQWPNPGDELPVVFDRQRTDRIQIQWHRIQTPAEQPAQRHTAATSPRTGASPERRAPTRPAAPAAEPMADESEAKRQPAPPR